MGAKFGGGLDRHHDMAHSGKGRRIAPRAGADVEEFGSARAGSRCRMSAMNIGEGYALVALHQNIGIGGAVAFGAADTDCHRWIVGWLHGNAQPS